MSRIDVTRAMSAKSDQLNAEDLIAGPRTIRITDVQDKGGEQPLWVFFEGDNGRPWKPSKTAIRCLAAVWGDDGAKWIGLHCTVFNDETVTWAGKAVGGIRVSHMEGLSQPRSLMLTRTRGKKAETIIQPLAVEGPVARWKTRLFAVAEGGTDLTVAQAWEKVPAAVKEELGQGLYDQLIALEVAAAEHSQTDGAQLEDLNAAIAAE